MFRLKKWYMKFKTPEERCLGHMIEGLVDIVERGGTPTKSTDNDWTIEVKRRKGD